MVQPLSQSFPPVISAGAHLLVLGSMPGVASLRANEYYAHPRNAFWQIMGQLFGATPAMPYDERLDRLQRAGIALWDVIASCERLGSLDSEIVTGSVETNDFPAFFAQYPTIRRVFFNGTAAETHFRRHVLPGLLAALSLEFHRLPSTSPAHAARNFAQKLAAWSVLRSGE